VEHVARCCSAGDAAAASWSGSPLCRSSSLPTWARPDVLTVGATGDVAGPRFYEPARRLARWRGSRSAARRRDRGAAAEPGWQPSVFHVKRAVQPRRVSSLQRPRRLHPRDTSRRGHGWDFQLERGPSHRRSRAGAVVRMSCGVSVVEAVFHVKRAVQVAVPAAIRLRPARWHGSERGSSWLGGAVRMGGRLCAAARRPLRCGAHGATSASSTAPCSRTGCARVCSTRAPMRSTGLGRRRPRCTSSGGDVTAGRMRRRPCPVGPGCASAQPAESFRAERCHARDLTELQHGSSGPPASTTLHVERALHPRAEPDHRA